MTSGERCKTVTVICAISAAGTYLPIMMIFPRKRMVDTLMVGAPPQSLGCCSSNGWTDSTLFLKWHEHFVKFTNSSPAAQHIIVIDGHHGHKTLAAIHCARQFGIHLIVNMMMTLIRPRYRNKAPYTISLVCFIRLNCKSRFYVVFSRNYEHRSKYVSGDGANRP
jgi:hypothetical protein